MKINDILQSVLKEGSSSLYLKDIFFLCQNMAFAYLSTRKNLKLSLELTKKIGCNLEDLACDSIAELFENKDGKYVQLNNYFSHIKSKLHDMEEDEITAYLSVLIRSKVNQFLVILKGDTGDIFIKVRKAVRIYLDRNHKKFTIFNHNNKEYVRLSNIKDPELSLPVLTETEVLEEIFFHKTKNNFVSEIINNIFKVISNREDKSQTIGLDNIYNIVKEFYIRRLQDHHL